MSKAIAKKIIMKISDSKIMHSMGFLKKSLNLKVSESKNALTLIAKLPDLCDVVMNTDPLDPDNIDNCKVSFIAVKSELNFVDIYLDSVELTPEELSRPVSSFGKANPRVAFSAEPKQKIDVRILSEIRKAKMAAKTSLGRLLTKRAELGYVGRTYIMDRCDILEKKGFVEQTHVGKSNRFKLVLTEDGEDYLDLNEELVDDIEYNYEDRVVKTTCRILKEMMAKNGKAFRTDMGLLLSDREELGYTTAQRIFKRIDIMVSHGLIIPVKKVKLADQVKIDFNKQEEMVKDGEITERENIAFKHGITAEEIAEDELVVTDFGKEYFEKGKGLLSKVIYSNE